MNSDNNDIIKMIESSQSVLPFLFLWKNLEIIWSQVNEIAQNICSHYNIPHEYIYTLKDDDQNIKVSQIAEFITPAYSKPGFWYQIFIIENISRLSLWASNSLLKLLEEPWKHNLIFLTNGSESKILDTILSRVQNISLGSTHLPEHTWFYSDMIENYIEKGDTTILNYFYKLKWDAPEYICFLQGLVSSSKNHPQLIPLLDTVINDMSFIQHNNVSGKYVTDRYLLKLSQLLWK